MTDTNYESLMDSEVGSASVVDVGAKEDEEVEEVVAVTRGSGDDDNGGDDTTKVQNQDALFCMLAFTSLVLLIQSAYDCDKSEYFTNFTECKDKLAFAVSVSVISLFTVILHFLISKVPEVNAGCVAWNVYAEPFLVLALWIVWVVAAVVLTYPDHNYHGYSFVDCSTGWLMIWLSVAVLTAALYPSFYPAWQWCQQKSPFFKNVGAPDGHSVINIIAVTLCSVTVMWSAADVCDALNTTKGITDCRQMYAWAVVCPMFSLLYCLFLLIFGKMLKTNDKVYQCMSAFLAVWWFFGAVTICVSKPFISAGAANGFFGTWLALYFSIKIAGRGLGIKLHVGYFGKDE